MTPAIVPMTIPAIAPPLSPCEVELETIGKVLPEAVAGEMKGAVVVTEVEVETPPLVGLNGAEKVLVAVAIVETMYVQLVNPLAGFGAQEPE